MSFRKVNWNNKDTTIPIRKATADNSNSWSGFDDTELSFIAKVSKCKLAHLILPLLSNNQNLKCALLSEISQLEYATLCIFQINRGQRN